MPVPNPLFGFLGTQRAVILDGGLATTLEDRGHDLDDELWSARVLLEDPAAIGALHRDFLTAGADIITTATYQASFQGLAKRGLSHRQAGRQFELALDLALTARDEFWAASSHPQGRLRPLVAASVGPFGAYLADGSEYAGRYQAGARELEAFHGERWEILASSAADLLAIETLPSLEEAAVLLELLGRTPERWAWFSFSCRDGASLCDGSPLGEAVELCAQAPGVAAIGVNCTAPRFISPLLDIARRITGKPLIVYPNSGEHYQPGLRTWAPAPGDGDWLGLAGEWVNQGARVVGGCCRTGPDAIADLRHRLLD